MALFPSASSGRVVAWAASAVLAALLLALAPARPAEAAEGDTFATADGVVYEVEEEPDGGAYSLGEVTLEDGSGFTGSSLSVPAAISREVDGSTRLYSVTAVAASAFEGVATLQSVEFSSDLTGGSSSAVGASAFEDCTALEEVDFPSVVAGIGNYAFSGCTSLATVSFPEGAELYTNSTYVAGAIGSGTFQDCISLASITVPAITSTVRKADAYYSAEDYNPDTNYSLAIDTFYSGYQGYWHDGMGPVQRYGIGPGAFSGCTSLRSVVLEAGSSLGMFAYWTDPGFDTTECPNLETVVYEDEQAYWGDPNGSIRNSTYTTDVWLDDDDEDASSEDVPTLYYAVDYYATKDEAVSDDAAGSGRFARVEYARLAPVASIATGDAEALEGYVLSGEAAALYASEETDDEGNLLYADGEVLDPQEAAAEAGLEGAEDGSVAYVWKLTETQSQREGLTDSCSAYLVEATDLSAGRLATSTMASVQMRCDQNLSRWFFDADGDGVEEEQDSSFDAERWFEEDDATSYDFTSVADDAEDEAADVLLLVKSGLEEDFFEDASVLAADGTEIAVEDCAFAYDRYDADTGELVGVSFEEGLSSLGAEGGPLLVTVTPGEDTGYTGELREWVLVVGNVGSVMERFTSNSGGSSGSWYEASAASEANVVSDAVFDSTYAVRVGNSDVSSALVAVGVAGLDRAPVNVASSSSSTYGFTLRTTFSDKTGAISGDDDDDSYATSFTASGDAASFAVKSYEAVEERYRSRLGIQGEWGSTAVLVDQGSLSEAAAAVAAYAYGARAPVFYLEEDGSVGEDTLDCLADFEQVLLVGEESAFDEDALAALEAVTGSSGEALSADASFLYTSANAFTLSLEVAERLIDEGLSTAATVTVSDGQDPFDAIGALNRSGLEGGVTLVASGSAESKTACSWLRARRDDVETIRLFGRSSGNALTEDFDLAEALNLLWDEFGYYEEPLVGAGDTLELWGARFVVGSGSGTGEDPFVLSYGGERLWGNAQVEAGTYAIGGVGEDGSFASGSVYVALAETLEPDEEADGDGADEGSIGEGSTSESSAASGSISSSGSGSSSSGAKKASKKSQKMKVTKKNKTVKAKKLKKKALKVKAITVKNYKGRLSFKKVSGSKRLSLVKGGRIKVKRGTKKGTYKIKVKVTAKGNASYKSASKTVTVKIKVK